MIGNKKFNYFLFFISFFGSVSSFSQSDSNTSFYVGSSFTVSGIETIYTGKPNHAKTTIHEPFYLKKEAVFYTNEKINVVYIEKNAVQLPVKSVKKLIATKVANSKPSISKQKNAHTVTFKNVPVFPFEKQSSLKITATTGVASTTSIGFKKTYDAITEGFQFWDPVSYKKNTFQSYCINLEKKYNSFTFLHRNRPPPFCC